MKRFVAALALVMAPAIGSAQNLLTNGGFETGDLFGWSLSLGSCASGTVVGDAGNHELAISTTDTPCTITLAQVFGPFSVSGIAGGGPRFSYRTIGGTLPGGFDPDWLMLSAGLSWGGCESYISSGNVIQPCDGYVSTNGPLYFNLTATVPAATTFFVDNVGFSASLEDGTPVLLATVTPEPASLVLLATGLVGLGLARRSSRVAE